MLNEKTVSPVPDAARSIKSAALWRFALTCAQFALVVFVIREFELVSWNFGSLIVLSFCGFVVQHFLPQRFRLLWFVFLSLFALKLVAGGTVAVWVTGCGLLLIGICHLPVPFAARVALLLTAAVVISLLRANLITAPVSTAAWIVLGSMFMFRTMCYVYELRHKTAPFDPVRALAYFFMLPNVCFVLFPLVDYRTFCKSHFSDEPEQLYARGLRWMLRGVIHLLLYRVVYQLMVIGPMETTDLLSVVRFMLATYLLYLRVSGWFHLIVGLLLMFGFNLPETHHFYLLASSFTDFWRRINIYWKDFLQKLFFYPAYFRLKTLGPAWAMALATLYAFFITWLLHSYQFFWIRGEWLFTWQDSLFWGFLALLVLANALWELRVGRRRSVTTGRNRTWMSKLITASKTIGTLVVICSLWTLWSCRSWEELAWLATAACNAPGAQIAIVAAGLAAIGLLGVWLGQSAAQSADRWDHEPSYWRSTVLVAAGASILLVVALIPDSTFSRLPAPRRLLLAVKYEGLNQIDLAQKRRGYYEELDVTRLGPQVQFLRSSKPDPWAQRFSALQQSTDGFLGKTLVPSARAEYAGTTVSINRWGMRDREYQLTKTEGVYRFILLGSSHELGWGVSDGEPFESLLEERLNSHSAPATKSGRYEVLNLAQPGHDMFRNLWLMETSAFKFQPDAIFWVVSSYQERLTINQIATVVDKQVDCPYSILNEAAANAKISPETSFDIVAARLRTVNPKLTAWAISHFAKVCRKHEIVPCLVFRPQAAGFNHLEREDEEQFVTRLHQLAKEQSIQFFDLSIAFLGHDGSTLINRFGDDHTNARGHRLLADELFRQMMLPERLRTWRAAAQQTSAERGTSPLSGS
jgi:hypothetical protein